MDNVKFIKVTEMDGTEREHAIIDRGNGEFTSMPKSVYDQMQKDSGAWVEPTLTR